MQPALAGTLRRLVEADARGRGHRAAGIAAARERFYRGDIAATIGAFSERVGGLLRASDLAGYRASIEAPLRLDLRGTGDPRPVGVDAGARAHAGPRHARDPRPPRDGPQLAALHPRRGGGAQARVRRPRAVLRRPRSAPVPIAELLAPAYARERAALIRMDRAAPDAPAAGDPRGVPAAALGRGHARRGRRTRARRSPDGTTHIAAIDRDGNMIALTPSGGVFRKSAFAPELGCTLSTRSEMFVLEDGHPNALVPGQAAAHDARELSDLRGRRADHDHRLPGRRRSGPGRPAARPQPARSSG